MNRYAVASMLIILGCFIFGILIYPSLPDRIVSQWGIQGEPGGTAAKYWSAFLLPTIALGMYTALLFLPRIDPLSPGFEKFRKTYDVFLMVFVAFLAYVYALTMLWNLGWNINMILALLPGFAALFFCSGILIAHTDRNWFIGIRTPWTISDELVWKKTHRFGSRLFKISGALTLLGFLWPHYAFLFIVAPIGITAAISIIYSYIIYRQEK